MSVSSSLSLKVFSFLFENVNTFHRSKMYTKLLVKVNTMLRISFYLAIRTCLLYRDFLIGTTILNKTCNSVLA